MIQRSSTKTSWIDFDNILFQLKITLVMGVGLQNKKVHNATNVYIFIHKPGTVEDFLFFVFSESQSFVGQIKCKMMLWVRI